MKRRALDRAPLSSPRPRFADTLTDSLTRLTGDEQKAVKTTAVDRQRNQAMHWTRLSCHRFRANEVRRQLRVLAYNLGKLWRRLGRPQRIKSWSLTSLQHRLMKTGGRLVKHARYYWWLLAEGHPNRKLFAQLLGRCAALPVPGRSRRKSWIKRAIEVYINNYVRS